MAGYFTIGSLLILRYNVFDGDALSRVANAGFTLTSRDPHLSAVGFVWNPLPSMVQIPLLRFARWWPELQTYGLSGVIQSAAFMAGAALVLRQIAIDRGVPPLWRFVAVACFALNPMIIIYASLGMSEAALVFCILWCVRFLLRWVETDRVGDLSWAGIALGVGYLVRYEMAPAAIGATVLVAVITFTRSPREMRLHTTILNILLAAFPFAIAFGIWALAGWIVSGELFATLSSQYGNSSQVAVATSRGGIPHAGWLVIAQRMLAMQPFVGIAVILALARCALARSWDALVPVSVCGAVLAFTVWGHLTGATFGWFRFYLLAVPLVLVIALVCWAPGAQPRPRWSFDWVATKLGAALLSASLLIGLPVTARSMFDVEDNQVMQGIASILDPGRHPPDEQVYRRMGNDDRLLARYLDGMNLPDGSVLADTFQIKVLWLASEHPKQFIITSDYDFVAALNRPWAYGVKYILVTNPAGNAAPDAVLKRYPTLWADGAGIGELALSAAGPFGEERWRLYRVVKPEKLDEPLR